MARATCNIGAVTHWPCDVWVTWQFIPAAKHVYSHSPVKRPSCLWHAAGWRRSRAHFYPPDENVSQLQQLFTVSSHAAPRQRSTAAAVNFLFSLADARPFPVCLDVSHSGLAWDRGREMWTFRRVESQRQSGRIRTQNVMLIYQASPHIAACFRCQTCDCLAVVIEWKGRSVGFWLCWLIAALSLMCWPRGWTQQSFNTDP